MPDEVLAMESGGFTVWLIYDGDEEHQTPVRVHSLPRAGEFIYDCRWDGQNVPYFVLRVEHIWKLDKEDDITGTSHIVTQIFIAHHEDGPPRGFRRPRQSVN